MNSPIPVTRSSMPELGEYINEISSLWESRWLTNMGDCHEKLRVGLCRFLKTPNLALFTNGHIALETALSALRLHGEVITTPFTFASTTQAIVRCGLTPVFCDISPEDFTIDCSKIEELITPRTSAVLPVHVYGNPCDVFGLKEITDRYGLKLVYDAAHAFGAEICGKGIGVFGDMSMFSFHATKVFHTIEGGGVSCHSQEILDRLSALRNFGLYSVEDIGELGGNGKMSEFHAAMGLCNLRYVEEQIMKRQKLVQRYRELLDGTEGLCLCHERKNVRYNYAYFPVVIDPAAFGQDRDTLVLKMNQKNIFPRKYFYPLTSHFRCFDGLFPIQKTPVAEQVAERILTLPLYADLTLEDVDYICSAILEARK